ncbi:ethanolamine ammonia-lyase subunit EutC [Psychrobacter sp. FBL11]|uniref:Ethanolamine ammonia-lyase small subunit n=2 Tax=Psychrobacter saeujeotis TaxID=3143436 RepID=A0ABU9X4V4_9GAMM|nr:ethanolamine ammonia-lyase subunit EutC [uncultured Psychrobacter sp.]
MNDSQVKQSIIDEDKPETSQRSELVHLDPWQKLKEYTDSRIALGRVGCSIPTKPLLKFQLDHAEAKDAVLQDLDTERLVNDLSTQCHLTFKDMDTEAAAADSEKSDEPSLEQSNKVWELFKVMSQAENKSDYLKRPDWGKLLNTESSDKLEHFLEQSGTDKSYDVIMVMGDGLSARALEENGPKLVAELIPLFKEQGWSIAPLVIATGSRVALGDKIAERLNAKMLIMLIGERPGLSSPDSLGIYYTWDAHVDSHDAMRNCISNVRAAGLPIKMAANRLLALMKKSCELKLSGVDLKDEQELPTLDQSQPAIKLL